MYKYFFSKSELAIYTDALKDAYVSAGTWPDDLVEISQQESVKFSPQSQPQGMVLGADDDGMPLWIQDPKNEENNSAQRLVDAQFAYESASKKITYIQQQIDDEDFSDGETEDSLTSEKSSWTAYRVKLRAYIKAADGSKDLPVSPDA